MQIIEESLQEHFDGKNTCVRKYFSTLITTPQNINWIATDSNGSIWGYPTKPYAGEYYAMWFGQGETYLGKAALEDTSWRDTLIEVE